MTESKGSTTPAPEVIGLPDFMVIKHSLQPLVEEAIKKAKIRWPDKPIQVSVDLDGDLVFTITAAPQTPVQ